MESINQTKYLIQSLAIMFLTSIFIHGNVNANNHLSPEIENIEITNNVQGGTIILGGTKVSASVRIPGITQLHLRELNLSYRSTRKENQPFISLGKMIANNGKYHHKLPLLNYGPYEVKLTAKLRPFSITPGGPAPDTIITSFQEFNINASRECFVFSTSDEGWTKSVVSAATSTNSIEPGSCLSNISNAQGQLVVNMGNTSCFPSTIPGGNNENFWKFDFKSPDLTDIKSWNKIKGTVIKIGANAPIQIQPIITYKKENGDIVSQIITDSDNNDAIVFHEIGDTSFSYHDIFSDFVIPAKATILNFRVRVFGRPIDTLYPEAFVSLDTVCPLVSNRPFIRKLIKPLPIPPFKKLKGVTFSK